MRAREDVTFYEDIAYGESLPALQTLDVYLTRRNVPTPVLIEIHGGGWRRGAKSRFQQTYRGFITGALNAGFSVISINYRLAPEYPHPAQVEDVTRAVQFVRSRAKEWNLDSDRFAAIGGSAGAHLAMWVGYHDDLADPPGADPVKRQSSRLQAVISCWGPSDLTLLDPFRIRPGQSENAILMLLGISREQYFSKQARDILLHASPTSYISADDPPTLFLYGDGPDDPTGSHDPRIYQRPVGPHDVMGGLVVEEKLKAAGVVTQRIMKTDLRERWNEYLPTMLDFLQHTLHTENTP